MALLLALIHLLGWVLCMGYLVSKMRYKKEKAGYIDPIVLRRSKDWIVLFKYSRNFAFAFFFVLLADHLLK